MDMDAMRKMMAENPEMGKKGMEEWGKWMEAHKADLADMGGAIGKNTQMSATGSEEKSNDIGGYSVLQAESKEAALAILKDNPHFMMQGSVIDIAEIIQM